MGYKAFISYRRKTSLAQADLVWKSILENSVIYNKEDIFLDRRSIGPEFFDEKILKSIKDSSCFVLLVAKGTFVQNGGIDWLITEISTAIDAKKTIIPVFFDNIKTIEQPEILEVLEENLTQYEIDYLIKSQAVVYSEGFVDESMAKLTDFIVKAVYKKESFWEKVKRICNALLILLVVLLIVVLACFGLGFCWGYFSSSTDIKQVLAENTTVQGGTLIYEFGGTKATYNVKTKQIDVEYCNPYTDDKNEEFKVEDMVVSQFSFGGMWILFDKNAQYLKYIKFLKGGSKSANVAKLIAVGVVFVGSIIGYSQGSEFGRYVKQREQADVLHSKLKDPNMWSEAVEKYESELRPYTFLLNNGIHTTNSSLSINDTKSYALCNLNIILKNKKFVSGYFLQYDTMVMFLCEKEVEAYYNDFMCQLNEYINSMRADFNVLVYDNSKKEIIEVRASEIETILPYREVVTSNKYDFLLDELLQYMSDVNEIDVEVLPDTCTVVLN